MEPLHPLIKRQLWLMLGALLLAVAAAFVPGNAAMRSQELSFDGGFNAQVARNLAEKHRYATSYRGLHDFDHRVQTGPTVIIPTAVAFRLFGVNNTTAQLTNLVYMVFLFLVTVLLAWRLSGGLAAYLLIPVLLATPHLFTFGMGLYGEIPALAFFLTGVALLHRLVEKPAIWSAAGVGLSLGLSVLTKFQMILPVMVLTLVVAISWRRTWNLRRLHLAAATLGFVAALLPMELVKLHTFPVPLYLEWWRNMLGRSVSQATSYRMIHTATGLHKPLVHLDILTRQAGLPLPLTVALIVLPPLLLVPLLRSRRRNPESWTAARTVTLTALAAAGLLLVIWWLVLAPTGRAWFRRILDGFILLEIVATIGVIELTRLLCSFRCQSAEVSDEVPPPVPRPRWLVVTAVILLAQVLSVLAWTRIPRLNTAVKPSRKRMATGAMVGMINSLPKDATIYAKGWYEAPVLGALTGREFLDLDEFPIERYRRPLQQTYFIADAAMAWNRPDEIEDVLSRAGAVVVRRTGTNTLYQMTSLCPYAPIVHPLNPRVLLTVFRPDEEPWYPYRSGIGRNDHPPSESHVVAGVLLKRNGLPCLTVDLQLNDSAGPHPTVTVRLNGDVVLQERAVAPGRFLRTVLLKPASAGTPQSSLVELALRRDGKPRPFMLWHSDWGLYSVLEVGFAGNCRPEPGEPGPAGFPADRAVPSPHARGDVEP